jgi:hypothetical protein
MHGVQVGAACQFTDGVVEARPLWTRRGVGSTQELMGLASSEGVVTFETFHGP